MDGKLFSMLGNEIPSQAERSESCVEVLKEWLEMAESGEIVSVAIAGGCADRSTRSGVSEHTESAASLVGQVEVLKMQIMGAL